MKVGLLGGSFNPPHKGHIHISELAIKKLKLNQVWWIPTAQNPFKDKSLYENYEVRTQKCRLITKNNSKIHIKELDEIYTEKLVRHLKSKHKDIEFFWIMGADNLKSFHKWKNFRKLIELIPIAVFSREKFLRQVRKAKIFHLKIPSQFLVFHTKNIDISSTQIRNNV